MWDWYNRPGGHARLRTRTVVIVLVAISFFTGVLFMVLYTLLAPLLFSKAPG